MKNNKFLFPLVGVTAISLAAVASIIGSKPIERKISSAEGNYLTVTLNGDNAVAAGAVAQNYQNAVKTRFIDWSYESAKAEDGYHVVLASGGTIKNELGINSILSISVLYEGSGLKLLGYNEAEHDWAEVVTFSNVLSQINELHYTSLSFSNSSENDVKIQSIEIKYSDTCAVYSGLNLAGTVTDAGVNPIEGATVSVSQNINGALTVVSSVNTDASGAYSFSSLFLPHDAFKLSIEKSGFESKEFDLTHATTAKDVTLVRPLKDYGNFGISALSRIYMTRDESAYRFRIVIPTANFTHSDDTFSIWLNFDGTSSGADRAGAHVLELKTTPTGWYGIYDYVGNKFLNAWWGTSLNVTQTVVGENTVIDAFITYAFINGDGEFLSGYPIASANTKLGFSISEYDAEDDPVFGGYSLTTGWFADPAIPNTYIFIGVDGVTSVLLGGNYTANEDGALPL